MSVEPDTLIIGAGMGGLSAAITARAAGAHVRVYDALSAPGGKVGVGRTQDGVEFDTGPSLLTMIDTLDEVFRAGGTSLEQELTLVAPEPLFRYIYADDTTLDVYHDVGRTTDSVRQVYGGAAAKEFEAFLAYSKGIWEAALPNFVQGEAPNYTSALVMGVTKFRQVLKVDPFRSMWEGICKHVSHPHLRMLLARYATYNGSNPYQAPATLNCIAWVEMGLGGWGIEGGMAELARALERVGRRMGVEFVYDTPVEQILLGARQRVSGVRLEDGARVDARRLIVNADATHLLEDLLPARTRHDIPAVSDRSMSGWTGVMKAPAAHDRRAAHTVLFPHDYTKEFEDIFDLQRPPEQPTVYMCDQTQSHKRSGWPDANPVFVMANAPPQHSEDLSRASKYDALEQTVEQTLKTRGFWGPQAQWVWKRRPIDLARQFRGSYGSIYGASSNSQTAAFKRPPNEVKKIPGLFLASGSAHPGGGVPMCVMSGQTAARAMMR